MDGSSTSWLPLATAAATVIAAIVTGFGAAALKNRWDSEVRRATWAREAQKDRRVETVQAYEAELFALTTAEQWLWHACNTQKPVLELEPEKLDSIRGAMRAHGAARATVELLGNASVIQRMAAADDRLVACWVDASRENLLALAKVREDLTLAMRADIGVQALPE